MAQDIHKYDDMIDLPHHVSGSHPQMDMMNRAAQFSPFAALTGYEEAIDETARLTQEKAELDENEKARLDEAFSYIREHFSEKPFVTVTYFKEDLFKAGGSYEIHNGIVKKIDETNRTILFEDGMKLYMEDIMNIEC